MDWNQVNALQVHVGTAQVPFGAQFITEAAKAYALSGRAARTQDFQQSWQAQAAHLEAIWNETVALFSDGDAQGNPRRNVQQVLLDTILNKKINVIDLNPQAISMSQNFKLYLMDFVFKKLRQISHTHYRQNNAGNCLIVLDEAGRFIPQDTGESEMLKKVCRKLTDSVKELRKMRCGFMFVTQTIAEIQKDVFRNLHYRIYGVGLGVGADANHIISREGDEAFELYRSLPDPRLSKTFSFMVAGVLLALGSSGRPMVIEGFPSGQVFLNENQRILNRNQPPGLDGLGTTVKR